MFAKTEVRQRIKQAVKAMSAHERQELSLQLMQKLAQHPRFVQSKVIMLYHALPDEPDTRTLLNTWFKEKTLLLPVVCGKQLLLKVYQGAQHVQTGAYGIIEPQGACFNQYQDIDLIVVPGMAFDAQGHRLGRGKGFYDRFLSMPQLTHTYRLALCWPCQLIEQVPTEPHDARMNEILTC